MIETGKKLNRKDAKTQRKAGVGGVGRFAWEKDGLQRLPYNQQMTRALAIRDIFRIKGRGTVLVPDLPAPATIASESLDEPVVITGLQKAGKEVKAHFEIQHFHMTSGNQFQVIILLPDVPMSEVVPGSDILIRDGAFAWLRKYVEF